jgi:hypothetical protein
MAEREDLHAPFGASIAEIVEELDLDPCFGPPSVVIFLDEAKTDVSREEWEDMIPSTEMVVGIYYPVEGNFIVTMLVNFAVNTAATGFLGALAANTLLQAVTSLVINLAINSPSRDQTIRKPDLAITPKSLAGIKCFRPKRCAGLLKPLTGKSISFAVIHLATAPLPCPTSGSVQHRSCPFPGSRLNF